ncbi:MAG: hypothetical protein ACI828_002477 [Flavobacteriales bacterium]|jgi:hypothetical protein
MRFTLIMVFILFGMISCSKETKDSLDNATETTLFSKIDANLLKSPLRT